jgi:hypothetical protein
MKFMMFPIQFILQYKLIKSPILKIDLNENSLIVHIKV